MKSLGQDTGRSDAGGAAPGPGSRKLRERIRANFDRGAPEYDRFEAATDFFGGLLDELLSLGPPLAGRRVLDVGCGTGASLERLARTVGGEGRVVGIDLSLGMLRCARTRFGGRARVAQMDGCAFGKGFLVPFDAVVYNAVLFLLPDAAASLSAARAVLGSAGSVYLSNLEGVFWAPDLTVPELLSRRGLPAGRHALAPWSVVSAQLANGFEPPVVRRLTVELSPERFLAFYGQEPMSSGLLPSVPYPERLRVVEGLAEELAREGRCAEQIWLLACARAAQTGGGVAEAARRGGG